MRKPPVTLNARNTDVLDASHNEVSDDGSMHDSTQVITAPKKIHGDVINAKAPELLPKQHSNTVRHFVSSIEKHIIRLRSEGVCSFNGLARELNNRGVASPRGAKWHQNTITSFIQNHGIDFTPSQDASKFAKSKTSIAKATEQRSSKMRDSIEIKLRNRKRQQRFANLTPLSQDQINAMVAKHITAGKMTKCPAFTDSEGYVHGHKMFTVGIAARPGVQTNRLSMEVS